MSQYDRYHVLYRGIVKWSYDVPLAPAVDDGVRRDDGEHSSDR
jgi:hypothetical protein